MDRVRKKTYFDAQKLSCRRCLEPSQQCKDEPIRAHSIQNSRVLDLLCTKGHVITPRLSNSDGVPDVSFTRIGRNKATTFLGLCGRHDQEIFKPIETSCIDPRNEMHLFLLAYRAVLKETHACMQAAARIQAGYLMRVEQGLSPRDRPDAAGLMATEWICNSYDTYEYKRKLDALYLGRDYRRIGHYHVIFEDTLPSIAVNALFSLDDIKWPDDVARVALNIFPESNRTHVLFSFLEEEQPYAFQYLERTLGARGQYQRYLVSKLVLQHCENFVISPAYFEAMSEERRAAILEFFVSTVWRNRHEYENENLCLF